MIKRVLCLILACMLCLAGCCERGEVESAFGAEKSGLPLYGLKIGIDPGHQLKGNSEQEPVSPGSSQTKAKVAVGTKGVSTNRPEHEVDLEIALELRDLLTQMGAQVLMTREKADVNISNVERAEMMNRWGADCLLRIHCNGSSDRDVHGMAMYVKSSGDAGQESFALARCLLESMGEATGAKKIGVFRRDIYAGLNWSRMPAVLVECGYMTNPTEDTLLSTPEYQRKLAMGAALGIAEYFGGAGQR
ncbi:MAG: N-acetylmuramoyl-L-alanine amidase [Clostridiales bacterium]|nr:N-acetylmuramoyl-L-alanine amidase [Clostridiales bacterium]